jgi:1,4-alpha-glucan branching enzyme
MERATQPIEQTAAPALAQDPLWFQDAVIYELHVKAFFDADNDGIGDFRGLTDRLDYLRDLGVTAIWLLPFYPSPMRDDGYDVSDYRNVHPSYGTRNDFRLLELLRTAGDDGADLQAPVHGLLGLWQAARESAR